MGELELARDAIDEPQEGVVVDGIELTEGVAVDYLEKSFGGWIRSYPFGGDDPLAVASTGFLWDNALLHGKSFRNYGEMNYTNLKPEKASFTDVYNDFRNGTQKVQFSHRITPEVLRKYSCGDYPGWNLKIPDAVRMKVFMREFEEAKRSGSWPNLITVYLPSDHTSGTSENAPTPADRSGPARTADRRGPHGIREARVRGDVGLFGSRLSDPA